MVANTFSEYIAFVLGSFGWNFHFQMTMCELGAHNLKGNTCRHHAIATLTPLIKSDKNFQFSEICAGCFRFKYLK
jgi:hypothetical protein